MMSVLRPTLKDSDRPGLDYKATYFRVLQSVSRRRALAHGRLHDGGLACSIGSYFDESDIPINSRALDEIAAYNDSFPKLSPDKRWRKVMAWLRFQTKAMTTRR